MATEYRYDAFLSYTTEADYLLARNLEAFLGRFHEIPTPENMPLARLRVWRDETGRRAPDGKRGLDITRMLEEHLPQCRYLLLLWSSQSVHSKWMRLEYDWFRTHREPGSILLAITDAADPMAAASTLFWPELIDSGLLQRPWYDFRAFRKPATHLIKLRDYEEAQVQLAADLNGYSPAEIQPLWWRNKVREQTERAEREAQERRRLEISECNARLEAARSWYERAFLYVGQCRYYDACRSLLRALAIAPADGVPTHYQTSTENPAWAEEAWVFLRYARALTPRLVRRLPKPPALGKRSLLKGDEQTSGWINNGRQIAILVEDAAVASRRSVGLDPEDDVSSLGSRMCVLSGETGAIEREFVVPASAGSITCWAGARNAAAIVAGTRDGWLHLFFAATGKSSAWRVGDARITAVALSPACDRVISGSDRGEICLWSQLANATPVRTTIEAMTQDPAETTEDDLSLPGDLSKHAVVYLAFTRSGNGILFSRGGELVERQLSGNSRVCVTTATTGALAHDGGHRIAYSDGDIVRTIERLPDSEDNSGREERLLYVGQHKSFVKQIVFSAEDRFLLTREMNGTICAWAGKEHELERSQTFMDARMVQRFGRSNRGSLAKQLEGIGGVGTFDCHPLAPDRILVERDSELEEWDLRSAFRPIARWRSTLKGSRCAAWLPDRPALVMASDDGSIQRFEVNDPEAATTLYEGDAAIGYLSVSHDGAWIAAATENGRVLLLAAQDGAVAATLEAASIPFTTAFVGDSGIVAVGLHDGTIELWDPRCEAGRRSLGTVEDAVMGLAVTADGATLVAASSAEVTAWDLQNSIERWSTSDLRGAGAVPDAAVGRLSLSPNGTLIAYGTISGELVCLTTTEGKVISVTSLPSSLPMKPKHVTAVAITNDNRTAVAGLWDGTACVIDLIGGRELLRFAAHTKVITSIAQSPASGLMLTSSIDPAPDNQFARVWSVVDDSGGGSDLTAFLELHGRGGVLDGDGDTSWPDLSGDDSSDKHEQAEPNDSQGFASLRAALIAEPASPRRNLDIANAYLAAGRPEKARYYLARVEDAGSAALIRDPAAQYLVAARALTQGETAKAIPWLIRAGDGGNAEALLQLGLLAHSRHPMLKEGPSYLEYFLKSAELGNAAAAFNMGAHYEHERHRFLAQSDWRKLAFGTAGSAPPADLVRALEWYEQSANADFAPAQVRIGDFFATGQVVVRDLKTARSWYERAARQDNTDAEAKLRALELEIRRSK